MYTTGKIIAQDNCKFTVEFNTTQPWVITNQGIENVGIYIDDGRLITPLQRKKIYAIIGDISCWNGYSIKDELDLLKLNFMAYSLDSEQGDVFWFSLSDRSPHAATVTIARNFITYLINFCITNDIPCTDSLLNRAEDIDAYIYHCMIKKKCVLCGKKADLHHWNSIGMGRDRKNINHIGMQAISLCRAHHSEAHAIGRETFAGKYHIYGITIDSSIANIYDINK